MTSNMVFQEAFLEWSGVRSSLSQDEHIVSLEVLHVIQGVICTIIDARVGHLELVER